MYPVIWYRDDIRDAIQQFRNAQPGQRLTGKTMDQLKCGVGEILASIYGPKTTLSESRVCIVVLCMCIVC